MHCISWRSCKGGRQLRGPDTQCEKFAKYMTPCESVRLLCTAPQAVAYDRLSKYLHFLHPQRIERGRQYNEELQALISQPKTPQGVAYWRAEQGICKSLSRHASAPAGQPDEPCISIEEIHAASQSKSFDYRVRMHAFCHAMTLPAFIEVGQRRSCFFMHCHMYRVRTEL